MSAEKFADAWLCPDCAVIATTRLTSLTDNYDGEDQIGFITFSKSPCFLCESPLHGERYRFAHWYFEENQTLPCQTCGTPVPADIHAEELGYCQPCQAEYFDSTQSEIDAFIDSPTREDNN